MSLNYLEYIMELLSPCGYMSAKAMFGGYGIYKNGVIVGIIVRDELYFKADASNKQQYENLDSEPFTYEAKGKKAAMSYWKVPISILEDEEKIRTWLEQSYQISIHARKKAPKRNDKILK